jgi:uncharacterized membrane protein YciS (DUF1049 family)
MSMMEIDDLIRQALSEEDARWFNELDEPSLREMVVDSFRGRLRWYVIVVYVSTAVLLFLAGYTLFQVFRAAELRGTVLYGIGFLFCSLIIAMLKIWYWMELNRNAMTREMKRVELQLARLSSRWGSEK